MNSAVTKLSASSQGIFISPALQFMQVTFFCTFHSCTVPVIHVNLTFAMDFTFVSLASETQEDSIELIYKYSKICMWHQ